MIKLVKRAYNLFTGLPSYIRRRTFMYCHPSVVIEKPGKIIGARYITIGEGSSIQKGTFLTAWNLINGQNFTPQISIGKDCHVEVI